MNTPDPAEELLTPAEVAAHFKVNPKVVTRWAREGRLPVARRTPGGHARFLRADIEAVNAPTASLNDLLVEALHTAERIAFTHDGDAYAVVAWRGDQAYRGAGGTPAEALGAAMRQLATARAQDEAGA